MSCHIPYESLESTLLDAYKNNFPKYRNLSAIIEDVVSLPIEEEAKIHAIWYYSGYVNAAANKIEGLQTKEWSEGKYSSINKYLEPFLKGKEPFEYGPLLDGVQKILGRNIDVEIETVEEKIIDDIADIQKLDNSDLSMVVDDVLNSIVENQQQLDPVIMDPANTVAIGLVDELVDRIKLREESPSKTTSILRAEAVKEELVKGYTEGIEYVSLSNTEGIGQYKGSVLKILRRANGDMFEVYYDKTTKQHHYYAPGKAIHETIVDRKEKDQLTEIYNKKPYNKEHINPDNLKIRFHFDEITGGLIIPTTRSGTEKSTIQEQMAETMPSDGRFYLSTRVRATTKPNQFFAERGQRIATNLPRLGRSIETTEMPIQDKALSNGQTVLTFTRPSKGFSVSISNLQGNLSFELEPVVNLAFLHPDNTVEELDFENPEHIQALKNMIEVDSVESRETRYLPITDAQIEQLKQSALRYKEFQKEVEAKMELEGTDIDISEIFYNYYDLTNGVVTSNFTEGSEIDNSLKNYIDQFNGRYLMPLQTLDENGNPTGEPIEEKVPIVLRKIKNRWEVVNTIGENQVIVAKNGEVYRSIDTFLEKEQGIDLKQWAADNFGTRNALYVSLTPVGDVVTPKAIPLVYQKDVVTGTDLADLVSGMQNAFANASIALGNTVMANWNNRGWGFDVNSESIRPEIVVLSQSKDSSKKSFGIRFVMLDPKNASDEQIAAYEEKKKAFNTFFNNSSNKIAFDSDLLNEIFDTMNKIYEAANVKVPSNITIEAANKLAIDAITKLGAENPLVAELHDKYEQFSNDIKEKFQKVIDNHDIALSEGKISRPLINDLFKNYILFDGTSLKLRKRNIKENVLDSFQKLQTNQITKLNLTFRNALKKIVIPRRLVKTFVADNVNPEGFAAPVETVKADEPIIDPSVFIPGESTVEDINKMKPTGNDEIVFSMLDSLETYMMLNSDEFRSEMRAMQELMPNVFTFTNKADQGIVVDGDILGYTQDLMIYLNDTLRAKGVAYHEGFHAVFRKLLTTAQQKYYLRKAAEVLGDYKTDEKGKFIKVGNKKIYANDFRKERRYVHLNDEQIKNLIYEEYLADGFAAYMETNKAPRTWMEKLFAWLKKLLNMFKKGGRIDNLFFDISIGKFRNSPIQETKPNTQTVFSIYSGIPAIVTRKSGSAAPEMQTIDSEVVNEVSDKMIHLMAKNKAINPGLTNEELFDIAREELLTSEYNIDNLINQNVAIKDQITDKYSSFYSKSRWLLGAFHTTNETFFYTNKTDKKDYENYPINRNDSPELLASSKVTANTFKSDVIKQFSGLEVAFDFDEIDEIIEKENKSEEEQELGENFSDSGFINTPVDDGPAAFRTMFKYIPYEYLDPDLGIKRTKMVDSRMIFSTIRKISCDLAKEDIVPYLDKEITRLTNNINYYTNNLKSRVSKALGSTKTPEDISKMIDLRDQLKAVRTTLSSITSLDADGNATTNRHVLIQFMNTFSSSNARLVQVELETKREYTKEVNKETITNQEYRVSDIVIGTDLNKIRQSLKNALLSLSVTKEEAEPYLKFLRESITIFTNLPVLKDKLITQQGTVNDVALRKLIDSTYVALSKFNLGISYGAVEILLTYNVYTAMDSNIKIFEKGSDYRSLLINNQSSFTDFEASREYNPNLANFLYYSLPKAIDVAIATNSREKRLRSTELDNEIRKVSTFYVSTLGEFILKYDPSIAGSSTYDAEGNKVNKFVKAPPPFTISRKLHDMDNVSDGLEQIIEDYYPEFRDFIMDNPFLNPSDPRTKKFLEILTVSSFAGFSQKFNLKNGTKEGERTTFKSIDAKSFALSALGLFFNKRNYALKGGQILSTFKRIITINEATSTNLIADGIYNQYTDEEGNFLKTKAGNPLYVLDFMKIVKQEYNLMVKNFKENADGTATKIWKDYNDNTAKGRGFNFNILDVFFNSDFPRLKPNASEQEIAQHDKAISELSPNAAVRVRLRDVFIEAARKGTSMESLLKDKQIVETLADQLTRYGKEEINNYKRKLMSLNIDETQLPSGVNTNSFLADFFLNDLINGMLGNQLFEGAIAVGVKDTPSYFKRNKSWAGAGEDLYNPLRSTTQRTRGTKTYNRGTTHYRAAVASNIEFFIDDQDLTKSMQIEPHKDEQGNEYGKDRNKASAIADGQSYNTLDRMRFIKDAQGKITPEIEQIIHRMHFITESSPQYSRDIQKLRDLGIVFNSVKTVAAAPFEYIKQSEHTLLRKDVSHLKPQFRGVNLEQTEIELDMLYRDIAYYSSMLEQGMDFTVIDEQASSTEESEVSIAEMYKRSVIRAHSYFAPNKNKIVLHNLLNSMELHRIEQFMDTNASKRATVSPIKIDLSKLSNEEMYLPLDMAMEMVPNDLTYVQVPTDHMANEITQGIQQKLLIIAQLDPSDPKYKEIRKDIETYQKGLADAVISQTKSLQRLLQGSDATIVGLIYNRIADGLREQGADETMLQWFELKPDGTPKYSPSLNRISRAVSYYYFSMFNKGIFDKKIAGRKFYHISPFGYQIIEETLSDGSKRIVTQEEYLKNPEKYADAKTRYPAFREETVEVVDPKTGKKEKVQKIYCEVILPKALRDVDQKFMEQYLSTFFGTRIPTEGRRSMVVCKVVDYIDEAYGSGIIVPYQMHMLAGSDFDIDSFYAHMKASYMAADGTLVPYGDYTHYMETYNMTEDEAKFVEYLHYLSKDALVKDLVTNEIDKIEKQSGYRTDSAVAFGEFFGGHINDYFTQNAEILGTKKESRYVKETVDNFKKLIATFNILQNLENSGLPVSPSELKTYTKRGQTPVVPVIFNDVLQSKINILSNKTVYEESLADPSQRADKAIQVYEDAVTARGLSEKTIYRKQSKYSPTAKIISRELGSESKDSLGISASFNKGVSMLATINARLKESVGKIWQRNEEGRLEKVKLQSIITEAVKLVGGSIGMYADATKNPYPGPLNLNTITTPVMLTMFSVGVPQRGAIMFQSLPVIAELTQTYSQTYGSAYSEKQKKVDKKFGKFLAESIKQDRKELLSELVNLGLLENGVLNTNNYRLIWTNEIRPDTPEEIASGIIPTTNFGWEIVDQNNVPLPYAIKNFILKNEFSNYMKLSNEISFTVTKLTDANKAIRPDIDTFDRLMNTYDDFFSQKGMEESKFTEESIINLKKAYPVLRANHEALKYMQKNSKLVMLDATSFMKGLTSIFSNIWGYAKEDVRKDLGAFVQLQLQKSAMEAMPDSPMRQIYLSLLDADNFLSGEIVSEVDKLKAKYPNNAFLKALTIKDEQNNVRVLEMSTGKMASKNNEIFNDFLSLLYSSYDTKITAFKIAYYGMIKSGTQSVRGSFYSLLPAIISQPMSDALIDLQKSLVELDRAIDQKYESFEDIDGVVKMPQEAEEEYNQKINEILSKSFKGVKLESIITDAISKLVSMRMLDNPSDVFPKTISPYRYAEVNTEVVTNFFNKVAPKSVDNITTKMGSRATLNQNDLKYRVGTDQFELFTPSGNTLELDLREVRPNPKMITASFDIQFLKDAGIKMQAKDGNYRFVFPVYRENIYGQMLVLKSINGKSVGQAFIDTLSQSDMQGDSDRLDLSGTTAVYEVVAKQGSTRISPLAFDQTNGAKIYNAVMSYQQMSSEKVAQLPSSMTVVRTSNRMYEIKSENKPSGNYLKTKLGLLDGSTISVANSVNGFMMIKGELRRAPGAGPEFNAVVNPEVYDNFAQTLGKSDWEDLKGDPKFKDFLSGKAVVFSWLLNSADINSPTAQPVQPTAQSTKRKTYSGKVTSLQPNQIFVFGSNPLGINGNPSKGTGGAALVAYNIAGVSQGEKMDNKLSDSGKAWGITTVTAPGKKRSKTAEEITEGIKKLYEYAKQNPTKEFLVSDYSGTNLNGYTGKEMADMFVNAGTIPSNIVFNDNFDKLISTQPTSINDITDQDINDVIKKKDDESKNCNGG